VSHSRVGQKNNQDQSNFFVFLKYCSAPDFAILIIMVPALLLLFPFLPVLFISLWIKEIA